MAAWAKRCGGIPEACLANEKQVARQKNTSCKDKCRLLPAIIEGHGGVKVFEIGPQPCRYIM